MAELTLEVKSKADKVVDPKPVTPLKPWPPADQKLKADPAPVPAPDKPKAIVDPSTVIAIAGIISKLPFSDTVKGYILKLFIFGLGIFCGIGLVYKTGVGPNPPTPPANVAVYQKRIEDLTKENTELRKQLDTHPPVNPPVNPPVTPLPFPPAVTPPSNGVRPAFIIPSR